MRVSEHVETLLLRIRGLFGDSRLSAVIDGADTDLADWLADLLGDASVGQSTLTIVDLSLVPTEIVHVLTAVIARTIFEALQRYRLHHLESLPTVLVMEEAHTFVSRARGENDAQDASVVCRQVFERLAREGRKFGLGLVLSSQRPSELSPTVLSQCNTFLLHRITNDRDQEIISRLVPDTLAGLLKELPSLSAQHAILLGWASELPVLVRMDTLEKAHRPHSDDPAYWNVWVGEDEQGAAVERELDWTTIAQAWQGKATSLPAASDSPESGAGPSRPAA